jgi:hypothetical protein
LNRLEVVRRIERNSAKNDICDLLAVVRDGGEGFHVDIVPILGAVDFSRFQIRSDIVSKSLVLCPVVLDEHPEVDVAPPVCLQSFGVWLMMRVFVSCDVRLDRLLSGDF